MSASTLQPVGQISPRRRFWVLAAALLALFLGALDTLIMSAAMPTIVADLGGMHLYSWVYSAYFLSRAISLPIFGKLADLYKVKTLFIVSIGMFLISSIMAGLSQTMSSLIIWRVFQGIGAGGNFALVYIALAEISPGETRGKTLSLASVVWGIASLLGPSLGGIIVTFFSWRWIFFMNIPLGIFSLTGISMHLIEFREKKREVFLDIAGSLTLSATVLSLLTTFIAGGSKYDWLSPPMAGLIGLTVVFAILFYLAERRAKDPIIALGFFKNSGFRFGNAAVFFSSFAIFALFAFAPVFIQGVLKKSPMQVGVAMLSLSFGWSVGSLMLGYMINRIGQKKSAVGGAVLLVIGCGMTLVFSAATTMATCFWVFMAAGLGMGFVTLSTLLIVQSCVPVSDLGVATASNQFARTLGGSIGVGICGGLLTMKLSAIMAALLPAGRLDPATLPATVQAQPSFEYFFRPEIQSLLAPAAQTALREALRGGFFLLFCVVLAAALICLCFCLALPKSASVSSAAQ